MFEAKVREAIDRIKSFVDSFGSPWVAFSGGKDSLVVLLMVLEAGIDYRGVVFVEVPGNTSECNIVYVYDVVEKLGIEKFYHVKREDLDFFDALVKYGVPGRRNRWCWNEFKVKVFYRFWPYVFLVGVKHSDSIARLQHDWRKPKYINSLYVFSPIYDWSTHEVITYIKRKGLELSPCYKMYGHSGNCMYCPFRNISEIRKTMSNPYWRRKIINALLQIKNNYGRNELRRWSRFYGRNIMVYIR